VVWLFNHRSEFKVVSSLRVWSISVVVEFTQVGSDFLHFWIIIVLEYLSIGSIEVVSSEASIEFESRDLFPGEEASDSGLDLDKESHFVH